MITQERFQTILREAKFGGTYTLVEFRPDQKECQHRTVLLVGIDEQRSSFMLVDYLAYEKALNTGKPLASVGRGVASIKDFLTGKKDEGFEKKTGEVATNASRTLIKSTVTAYWIPFCWIETFNHIGSAHGMILETLKETHPPVGLT